MSDKFSQTNSCVFRTPTNNHREILEKLRWNITLAVLATSFDVVSITRKHRQPSQFSVLTRKHKTTTTILSVDQETQTTTTILSVNQETQTTTTILSVDSFGLFSIFINSYNVHVCIFNSIIVIYFTFVHWLVCSLVRTFFSVSLQFNRILTYMFSILPQEFYI